jgi:hypothetical protein
MVGNAELRQQLQRITDEFTGCLVQLQIQHIERLRGDWNHRIRLVEPAVAGKPRTYDFNCHAFTFGLHELQVFWELRRVKPELWPTGEFVTNRLMAAMPRIRRADAVQGDVVLYFNADRIAHSGICARRDVVESKWGTAHRWRHGVFEVPSSYGNMTRYFRRPSPEHVRVAFLEFAKAA